MNKTDPFHTAQNDITALLTSARSLHASYTRILRTANVPAKSPELLSARQDLLSALEELSADLQDLIDSVKAVEGDPYRYGLDVEEVGRRRKFVQDVAVEVEGLRGEVDKPHAGTAGDGRGATSSSYTSKGGGQGGGLPDPNAFDSDAEDQGDGYAEFEEQRQQELLQEQDVQLDGVFRTVGNLRMQADEMGRELEEQGELLDGVDTLTERVGGKLQNGVKKIGWVIRKNEDTASSWCIALLIGALILLLVLVLIL